MTGFTTPDELVGSKSVKNGATYFEYGIVTDAMQKGAILVIDEINATTPDCLFILHGLLDEDKQVTLPNGEVIKPHKNFRVFATCNPEYEGTKSMNRAFKDRFPIILEIDVLPVDQEKQLLMERTKIKVTMANKLVTVATMIRKDYTEQKIETYASTRSLLEWSDLMNQGLSPREAYTVTLMRKTDNKTEQKVLLDFYLATFKEASGTANKNMPIVVTQAELDTLKNKANTKIMEAGEHLAKKLDAEASLALAREKLVPVKKEVTIALGEIKALTATNNKLEKELDELNSVKKILKRLAHAKNE